MLSREQELLITRVEGAAPAGQLLRRYWHPIAGLAELDERPTKAVRVFGEDLVLFKDRSGQLGLVERRCPHRGADLSLGIPEPRGLRCVYHGWVYGSDGTCLAQPYEDTRHPGGAFRSKCSAKAYPVKTVAGMVFAYLGPAPAPSLPDWDFYSVRTHKLISWHTVPCNWLVCQENSLDPVHFEWLHDYWTWAQTSDRSSPPPIRRHLKVDFDEFEWGFIYRRLREGGTEEDPEWSIGRVSLWPNAFYAGAVTWYVPVDDHTTLVIGLTMFPLPDDAPDQRTVPAWQVPIHHRSGELVIGAQYQQDTAVWITQDADRTREHLGESDRGIIMYRRRLLDEIDALHEGRALKAQVDPAKNRRIPLPAASFGSAAPGSMKAAFAGFPEDLIPPHLREE